jgi:hypothetical protein
MNTNFRIGNVVPLKSGGLKMTITDIREEEGGLESTCGYTVLDLPHNGVRTQKLEVRCFRPEVLQLVRGPKR